MTGLGESGALIDMRSTVGANGADVHELCPSFPGGARELESIKISYCRLQTCSGQLGDVRSPLRSTARPRTCPGCRA